jgi:hypothetical protein
MDDSVECGIISVGEEPVTGGAVSAVGEAVWLDEQPAKIRIKKTA